MRLCILVYVYVCLCVCRLCLCVKFWWHLRQPFWLDICKVESQKIWIIKNKFIFIIIGIISVTDIFPHSLTNLHPSWYWLPIVQKIYTHLKQSYIYNRSISKTQFECLILKLFITDCLFTSWIHTIVFILLRYCWLRTKLKVNIHFISTTTTSFSKIYIS